MAWWARMSGYDPDFPPLSIYDLHDAIARTRTNSRPPNVLWMTQETYAAFRKAFAHAYRRRRRTALMQRRRKIGRGRW
jgi:hypothetical protein